MEIPVHWVDKLTLAELTASAALASGETLSSFEPLKLFMDEACVMEKWGKAYRVSVKIPGGLYGIPAFSTASAFDPLEACMKAVVKRHAALTSRS